MDTNKHETTDAQADAQARYDALLHPLQDWADEATDSRVVFGVMADKRDPVGRVILSGHGEVIVKALALAALSDKNLARLLTIALDTSRAAREKERRAKRPRLLAWLSDFHERYRLVIFTVYYALLSLLLVSLAGRGIDLFTFDSLVAVALLFALPHWIYSDLSDLPSEDEY